MIYFPVLKEKRKKKTRGFFFPFFFTFSLFCLFVLFFLLFLLLFKRVCLLLLYSIVSNF